MPSTLYNGGRIKGANLAIHHFLTIVGEKNMGRGGGEGVLAVMLEYNDLERSNVNHNNQIPLKQFCSLTGGVPLGCNYLLLTAEWKYVVCFLC